MEISKCRRLEKNQVIKYLLKFIKESNTGFPVFIFLKLKLTWKSNNNILRHANK
jgi:hypothetical protein